MKSNNDQSTQVLIVGGSYAGMSAALSLGRSLRRVIMVDNGQPCNRQTPHSHNFLTRDGYTPVELASIASSELARYPTISRVEGTVEKVAGADGDFEVLLAGGGMIRAEKLLFATGIRDMLPQIPGFAECWGISLVHCPYCHGYEVAGRRLGVIANGDTALEFARMIRHWSPTLTLFTNGPSTLPPADQELLERKGVRVLQEHIAELQHDRGYISSLRFDSGAAIQMDAVFFRAPFKQSCEIPALLGCNLDKNGLLAGNELGQTNVPGIYVAGDNSSPMRAVAAAVAAGTKAGAMVNRELIMEAFAR